MSGIYDVVFGFQNFRIYQKFVKVKKKKHIKHNLFTHSLSLCNDYDKNWYYISRKDAYVGKFLGY